MRCARVPLERKHENDQVIPRKIDITPKCSRPQRSFAVFYRSPVYSTASL